MKNFRKFDYIIVFIMFAGIYLIQLIELDARAIILILIAAFVVSLILGTITNLIFKKTISK